MNIKYKNDSFLRPCYIIRAKKIEKALFHMWIVNSYPTKEDPKITQVLGIVEFNGGEIEQVQPKSIRFADGLFSEFVFIPYEVLIKVRKLDVVKIEEKDEVNE